MKTLNDDDFVAHYEGGVEQLKKKGCFHDADDRDWMKIDPGDLTVIDDLVELEHPLKKVPRELIYSDLVYRFTCKHR